MRPTRPDLTYHGAVSGRDRLAVDGGPAVRETPLGYARPWIGDDDRRAVLDVLEGDLLTTGPKVAELERAFATYVGARHAIAMSSGTAALHAALSAAVLDPGDEVLVPTISFVATANAALYVGAKPVFTDVVPDSLSIDLEDASRRLTPRTRAIIAVDYAGHPVAHGLLHAFARAHGLRFIEDACHAPGATTDTGERVGSLADSTVFSLHAVKPIAAGEGGLVTTDDDVVARRLSIFRNHGITTEAAERERGGQHRYDMVALGYNYRLSDIHCALALSQLGKAEQFLQRREALVSRYEEALRGVEGVQAIRPRSGSRSAWHLFVVQLDLDRLSVSRDVVMRAMFAEGIRCNVHYLPIHLQPYYRENLGTKPGLCPGAERAYERLLTLPLFARMEDRDVDDVMNALRKVLGHYRR